MDKELKKQFYRDLRSAGQNFVAEIATICAAYGTDYIPLSSSAIAEFWGFRIDRLIDRDFRRTIERKVKRLKKKLNPFWRTLRKKLFGG